MRTLLASIFVSTVLFGASAASADDACWPKPSALSTFDTEPDVVRVRVVPGSAEPGIGGVMARFEVLETLRGSTKAGTVLSGASGGPCAWKVAENTEYVFPLGHPDTVGVGNVNAGTREPLSTSLALQLAIAKTKPDDVRGRTAIIYRAATARTAKASDRASLRKYLEERPDVAAALTKAQRRRLDTVLAEPKT